MDKGYGNTMKLGDVMLTKIRFNRMIETAVKENALSYIDAIVYLCEENNLEIEDVKKFIGDPIKEKLEAEARRLNYLPRGNELPL
jgi:hypothetical protein